MRKTKYRYSNNKITVDIETLSAMLSCGRDTAKRIGEDAEARVFVGRRVFYSVPKIEAYIDNMTN